MSAARWADAMAAVRIFAADPAGTGLLLRARAGPVRARFVAALASAVRLTHVPLNVAEGRLLGGLDLAATLQAGRPVAAHGLLAEADGGVIVLAMAERLSPMTVAHVTAAMDRGTVAIERDGLSLRAPARFGVVALDEGIDGEGVAEALRDRLALHLDLDGIALGDAAPQPIVPALSQTAISDEQIAALCSAAAALGIASLRAPMLAAVVAARADLALAARLVLAPRATVMPTQDQPPPDAMEDGPSTDDADGTQQHGEDRPLDDVVLAAAQAAIPANLLAALASSAPLRSRMQGKAGARDQASRRGRPNGARRGDIRAGAKVNIIETLRAAAPWQAIRRRECTAATPSRLLIRKDDIRISRFLARSGAVTIFVVDASGSAALHRLAEAKGAVELLLADCYVRRDQVALIAFRGVQAEVLLPPTRSLARARRSLAGLPGGGGTPLAAGLDTALLLADAVRRKGQMPVVILLTDGRANIARDGTQGRPRAEQDAADAARQLRAAGVAALLVDTSSRSGPQGETVARDLGARYLPLPYADAMALSAAVRAGMPS